MAGWYRHCPRGPTTTATGRTRRQSEAARGPAWVLLPGTADETRARPLLERTGYVRTLVGGFAVYEQMLVRRSKR